MKDYWEGDPLWQLIFSRRIMEPMRIMQLFKIERSSWAWERKQQARLARLMNSNLPTANGRDYSHLLAAENVAFGI